MKRNQTTTTTPKRPCPTNQVVFMLLCSFLGGIHMQNNFYNMVMLVVELWYMSLEIWVPSLSDFKVVMGSLGWILGKFFRQETSFGSRINFQFLKMGNKLSVPCFSIKPQLSPHKHCALVPLSTCVPPVLNYFSLSEPTRLSCATLGNFMLPFLKMEVLLSLHSPVTYSMKPFLPVR